MAVAFASVGASDTGTTSLDPGFPAGVQAGDGLVMFVANKYAANPPDSIASFSWTFMGRYTGGQGASGVDAGVLGIAAYFREADGTEIGVQNVGITGGNSGAAVIHRYVKDPARVWDIGIAGGSDNTAGVTWLITGDVDPGFISGDVLVIADAINADLIGFVDHSLSIPGVVTGAIVVGRASQSWTDGDDGRLATHELTIAAGPSSGVITWTFDRPGPLANAPAGASLFVRLRDVAVVPPDPTPTGVNVVQGVPLGRAALRRLGKMAPPRTGQKDVDRALDHVVSRVNPLLEHPLIEATPLGATLQPGLNKIGHGTGRAVTRFLWNTDLDGAIVSSRQADNPHPDRDLWVWLEATDPAEVTLLLLPGV